MAEVMKARIMARVEAASLEVAQVTEAPAANAAANASEEKPAVQKAKAQARRRSLRRGARSTQLTPSEKAERLRHEKEMKQLAQANRAHQAKAARAGIGTAVVLTRATSPEGLARGFGRRGGGRRARGSRAAGKKSAMRGKSKKGVAFAADPVEKKKGEQKKDVAYYRAEIAAAEVLGKHDMAEALYNEARALGLELPHWRSDGARARQLSARPAPVMTKDMTPAQYAMQMMELDPDEEPPPQPEPAPAAPVAQVMDRPEGSSAPIEAAVEELGSTITIRLQQARYDTKLGEPWRATTKAVDGTVEIHSSKRDRLTLHFSSADRAKGNLKGKITTPPPPKPRRKSRNPDDSGSSSDDDIDDDLYAKDLVLAEFHREGARAYPGVKKTGGGKNLCEVSVGGVVHGTIPGGDSLPEFRRTIQHLSDLSDRKDDNGTIHLRMRAA